MIIDSYACTRRSCKHQTSEHESSDFSNLNLFSFPLCKIQAGLKIERCPELSVFCFFNAINKIALLKQDQY